MASATDWNVVVAGAWNVAILTPDGIKKLLFDLEDATPVEVEVLLDRLGPLRVVHDDLIVAPSSQRLEIILRQANRELMVKACKVAERALSQLDRTPVYAAGINMRYRISAAKPDFLRLFQSEFDSALAQKSLRVMRSGAKRVIEVPPGVLNLDIELLDASQVVFALNYHLESRKPTELIGWLQRASEFVDHGENTIKALEDYEA